jgi:hypothetical protein
VGKGEEAEVGDGGCRRVCVLHDNWLLSVCWERGLGWRVSRNGREGFEELSRGNALRCRRYPYILTNLYLYVVLSLSFYFLSFLF